jgi:hypothetical protein
MIVDSCSTAVLRDLREGRSEAGRGEPQLSVRNVGLMPPRKASRMRWREKYRNAFSTYSTIG